MKNRLLVISSYPPYGETHNSHVVGVATYTKNTIQAIEKTAQEKQTPLSITVLAEKLPGTQLHYTENTVTVKRLWQRNSLKTFFILAREILLKHRDEKAVLLELELAMFGGVSQLVLLPLFLLLLILLRKKVTLVFHQVIVNASEVHALLNIPQKGILVQIYTFLIQMFYRLVLLLSEKSIVFDEYLRDQLKEFGSGKNIIVIPHGIEAVEFPTKQAARSLLKLPQDRTILLCFGYLTWYKGLDLLIDMYDNFSSQSRPLLILAGGQNPNHADKFFHKKYIENLKKKSAGKDILITGFVAEKMIASYYAAADVCILPYRTFMSASGPLSFVFAAHKPFLLSRKLEPTLHTADIMHAMKTLNIYEKDITFPLEKAGAHTIETFLANQALQNKTIQLGEILSKERSWEQIGKVYYETLTTE